MMVSVQLATRIFLVTVLVAEMILELFFDSNAVTSAENKVDWPKNFTSQLLIFKCIFCSTVILD